MLVLGLYNTALFRYDFFAQDNRYFLCLRDQFASLGSPSCVTVEPALHLMAEAVKPAAVLMVAIIFA